MTRKMPFSGLACAIVVLAVLLSIGLFGFSRAANQRDGRRLLTLQATEARTSVTAVLGSFESAVSSVGSVAASTDANSVSLSRLATALPSLKIFTTLTVLHTTSPGNTSVVSVRGNPSDPLGVFGSASGQALARSSPPEGSISSGFSVTVPSVVLPSLWEHPQFRAGM